MLKVLNLALLLYLRGELTSRNIEKVETWLFGL